LKTSETNMFLKIFWESFLIKEKKYFAEGIP
jgi:hypothetical protein